MKGRTERRAAVFAALRRLLLEHPWGEVTLEAIAQEAGVSRQTLYNAFGSRHGLAASYTMDLADALCDAIGDAIAEHGEDRLAGLEAGLRLYLSVAAADPLIQRVQAGEAHPDLVRIVTVEAGPLLLHVRERLESLLAEAWPDVDQPRRRTLARVVARLAVSYVSTPPEDDTPDADLARDLAALLAG